MGPRNADIETEQSKVPLLKNGLFTGGIVCNVLIVNVNLNQNVTVNNIYGAPKKRTYLVPPV